MNPIELKVNDRLTLKLSINQAINNIDVRICP